MITLFQRHRATYLTLALAGGVMHEYAADQNPKDALKQLWSRPITMQRSQVESYFKNIFPAYGYGSFACGHLIDFIGYSKQVAQPIAFVKRIIDLFHTRIKEATWINAYTALQVLQQLVDQAAPIVAQAKQERLTVTKKHIYHTLIHRLRELRQDPEAVVTELAEAILASSDASEFEALQNGIARLVEAIMDRLIWSPEDQTEVWENVKSMAITLCDLQQAGLIRNTTVLNHCLWSLTYRFAYFIEMAGEYLRAEAYQVIKHDIATQGPLIFTCEENSYQVMPLRAQWLRDLIIAGEVRSYRAQDGAWINNPKFTETI